jgi:hypothetical protein
MQFGTRSCKEKFTDYKKTVRLLSDISEKAVGTGGVSQLCITKFSVRRNRRGKENSCIIFSFITGIGANMLLIIFLGIIANSALMSDACDGVTPKLKNFDWRRVGIGVFKCLL